MAGFDVVLRPTDVRRHIGLVFQDTTLDDYLTAEENLRLHAELYGVPRREMRARLDQVLEMVGLLTAGARHRPHVLRRHEAPAGDRTRPPPLPRGPVPG